MQILSLIHAIQSLIYQRNEKKYDELANLFNKANKKLQQTKGEFDQIILSVYIDN